MKHVVLAVSLFATLVLALASAGTAAPQAASCTVSPNPASVDGSWTVTAANLPGGEVNRVEKFPDGALATMRIDPAKDGSYSETDTAWYGHQSGTYTYQFVGRVSWPSGSWSKTYATCTVEVG